MKAQAQLKLTQRTIEGQTQTDNPANDPMMTGQTQPDGCIIGQNPEPNDPVDQCDNGPSNDPAQLLTGRSPDPIDPAQLVMTQTD